ncbi:hypothetical protein EVAR_42726_1 [Eumeta japonica]|uniref:Uncharacterized protein n=1 Tax=Eumeta variegata TaxID=151549 RepID=A0A4C1XG45_EUMVA|nr:hypothetical protein EVAR_42726_1 [Eumeta japonica]
MEFGNLEMGGVALRMMLRRSTPWTSNEIVDIVNNLNSDDEATDTDIYIDPHGDETKVIFENLSQSQLSAPAEPVLSSYNDDDDSQSEMVKNINRAAPAPQRRPQILNLAMPEALKDILQDVNVVVYARALSCLGLLPAELGAAGEVRLSTPSLWVGRTFVTFCVILQVNHYYHHPYITDWINIVYHVFAVSQLIALIIVQSSSKNRVDTFKSFVLIMREAGGYGAWAPKSAFTQDARATSRILERAARHGSARSDKSIKCGLKRNKSNYNSKL